MFQLASLVVLCGLLRGTSESDLDALQKLKFDLGLLQETKDFLFSKNNILRSFNTLDLDDLKLLSSQDGLWFRNKKLRILDLQVGLSSDGKGMDLTIPLIMNASLFMPKFYFRGEISVSKDFTFSLPVETNAQTDLPILAIGNCFSDAEKVTISVLGRKNIYISGVPDSTSGIIKLMVANFPQNELCSLFQSLLRKLDVNLIEELISILLAAQLPVFT